MTPEDNEKLTRVGPGTPGGEMLRRYWWPVGFEEQIEKKPVKVRHLGEDFVLFRDGNGKIGMLDTFCSHRRASLEHGRVEHPAAARAPAFGKSANRRRAHLRLPRPRSGADHSALRLARDRRVRSYDL